MTLNGLVQLAIYFLAVLVVTKPVGLFMAKIFSGEPTLIGRLLRPVELLIYQAKKAADGLIDFARREGITHVIFGQSSRTRWDILLQGSVLNRFLGEVKGAAVQVIPPSDGVHDKSA